MKRPEDNRTELPALIIRPHCTTCKYEHEVDRHECNACARAWNESGYTLYIGWEPKKIAIGPEDV